MNLLLGLFPVPPFLLPVYEAASVDYGVPWEVLAAINEVETDYGRDLSTSRAGAIGWMQFLPSTWTKFGLDADGRGSANPYDPVDAIFAAARYLHLAGAQSSLAGAIFAYNHADWYVTSVELRARLLQYLPQGTIEGLTGLMEGIFPVAGHLGRYARHPLTSVRIAGRPATVVHAPVGAPVIAAADSRVLAIGHNRLLGHYITLEDSYGDTFIYSGLARLSSLYPVLEPRVESALKLARQLRSTLGLGKKRLPAATELAGSNVSQSTSAPAGSPASAPADLGVPPGEPSAVPLVKERLFADPARPASYAAGGRIQVQSTLSAYAAAADIQVGGRGPSDYFSQPVQLKPSDFTLAPLRRGAVIAAGTILGRVGRQRGTSGLTFQIQPDGARRPVDADPILAGWELVGRLTAGRSALVGAGRSSAFGGQNPTLGQLLLAGKRDLGRAVLSDRRVSLDSCGRDAVRAGGVDRRILAVLEYLSYSGLAPTASGFGCGRSPGLAPRFYVSELNRTPVAGHQQPGGLVDVAVRRLLGLQGALRPTAILSRLRYPMQPGAISSPTHEDRIEIRFAPNATIFGAARGRLDTAEWGRLMRRLTQISSAQP